MLRLGEIAVRWRPQLSLDLGQIDTDLVQPVFWCVPTSRKSHDSGNYSEARYSCRIVFDPGAALKFTCSFRQFPATVPEIRQMLSLFLNVYPSKNKNAGSVLSESILPLLKAHKSMSPEEKEEIDPLSVAKLIVSLLRSDICLPPDDVKEVGSISED